MSESRRSRQEAGSEHRMRAVRRRELAAAVAPAKLPDAPAVLIAYSGGKDSLATLDICVRAGKRIEAFFMYFLPGMDYTAYWCEFAARRWGVKPRQYQHWNTTYFLRRGVFREPIEVPKLTIKDIEFCARRDCGLEWIGYGYKKIDSLQRRGWLTKSWPGGLNKQDRKFTPIADWNNTEVKAYLSRHGLPLPGIDGKRSTGINLTPECLDWLRSEWPDDYRLVLKFFPYAEAQADRAAEIRASRKRTRKIPEVRIPGDCTVSNRDSAVQSAQAL